jgi:hypothetical protein
MAEYMNPFFPEMSLGKLGRIRHALAIAFLPTSFLAMIGKDPPCSNLAIEWLRDIADEVSCQVSAKITKIENNPVQFGGRL